MEEENQVLGKDAEAVDSNMNLESEDFNFYHQNKEEAKKNIDSSSADLSDFIDSLIQDVPDPSAEEVNSGIEKILEITHPTESKTETSKTNKSKKVTFKVLFIAALLSILSFSCLYVVGSSHNISIENGFVSFAKDTIQIAFFGEEKEKFISVDSLLLSLKEHGYDNIVFPDEFVTSSNKYKVTIPKYSKGVLNQVLFDVYNENSTYSFAIYVYDQVQKKREFDNIKTADDIKVNDICIFLFEFDTGTSAFEFTFGEYHYYVHSLNAPYSDMVKIANTLK